MKQIYLDYSATTPVKEEVLEKMIPYFTHEFGNPSSLYTMGQNSKQAIEVAREQVASLIKGNPKEIYFTSSGTEADNWAVLKIAEAKKAKGNHIITTSIEHHAILHICEYLEKIGFQVTYLKVDKDGLTDLNELEASITNNTILISIMFANNEIGTIQPIKKISEIAKKHKVIFHTDAVQALGNLPIDVHELGIDMMSISAHKIYGPKGIGALYIRRGIVLQSLIHGGAQERNKRAGTETLPGIVGFGEAAELAEKNLSEHIEKITALRDYFIQEVTNNIPDIRINGSLDQRLPGNANITFKYIEGEALLLLLDMEGIYISTGSACSSASLTPSHVLTEIGVPVEQIHGSLRFSIGDFTTKEELDYVVKVLIKSVDKLRKISSVSSEKGW